MHVHRASSHEYAPMAREVVFYSNKRASIGVGSWLSFVRWGGVGALMRLMMGLFTYSCG